MSLADDIRQLATKVTKRWTRQRKREERSRGSRAARAFAFSGRTHFTDVMDDILPGAYRHASGEGRYTCSKRQLYYASRKQFNERADRAEELTYKYFADTLLVQYRNTHPEAALWKITADPRGTLTIPHARRGGLVPVGTIAVNNHLAAARKKCDPFRDAERAHVSVRWPSLAGGQRYQAVLYIEKEGFEPMLEEARIGERFDLAIISCKGQSVVAARRFVDEVCAAGRGVKLFVLHDLDKSGFEISQRLTKVSPWAEKKKRVTYKFKNAIDVTDLGLRLADARAYGLEGEPWEFSGHFAPDSIATKEEKAFLRSGQRIELNEFTSPQFVEYLEAKLRQHLPERLIPPDSVLEDAYRRALAVARINHAIKEVRDEAVAKAKAAEVPKNLRRRLKKLLKDSAEPWDKVLYRIAAKEGKPSRDGGE
jgi:hypothetical protein